MTEQMTLTSKRKCGKVRYRGGVGVYITPRKPIHFVKKYHGFGITLALLNQLQDQRVKYIEIPYEGETGKKVYQVELDKFMKEGIIDSLGGFEKQMFLDVDKFRDITELIR